MRKKSMSLSEAKDSIERLKGKLVQIKVNKGRKRILRYSGRVLELYPSVFTLKIDGDKNVEQLSCSYSDVICGDIVLVDSGGI